MRRGEVRWYRFGRPDKKRPVLVLTRDSALDYLGEVTIAPMTTTIRDIPSDVRLGPEDGVPRHCAVNCDHLQTVSKARLGKLVTRLPADRMKEVSHAVTFALDL
ncbi:MAG: type II toxin-antitoxin system PemK/MazF family toxin [Wenzhouxiangellaceae bacterium]|nr:type II toxin-antitoxin system PemK/MazF family toxin [Wenzhouxiangellaceae bacterium]